MSKKFTIIVPCYNAENYIERCISSALDQDYENCEVIVVDNDSADDSLEIVEELYEKRPEFVLDTAPNIYPFSWSEPVEKALEMATGEYFTILGADDYLDSGYVSNVMEYISNSSEDVQCFQSALRFIDEDGNEQDGQLSHTYNGTEELKDALLEKCVVTTPSVVFSKKLYDKDLVKWDSENYLGAADYALYFKLVDSGVYIHPNPEWLGYHYRWHKGQATWGMQKQPVNFDFMLQNEWRQKWDK